MLQNNIKPILVPSKISEDEFVSILKQYDSYFAPRLSTINDIDIWANKVYCNAIVDCYKDDTFSLIGLAAYYCNNSDIQEAFLTLIFTDRKFQGMGYSSIIFSNVLTVCKNMGMKILKLECGKENSAANKFYEKMQGSLYYQNANSFFYSFSLK